MPLTSISGGTHFFLPMIPGQVTRYAARPFRLRGSSMPNSLMVQFHDAQNLCPVDWRSRHSGKKKPQREPGREHGHAAEITGDSAGGWYWAVLRVDKIAPRANLSSGV